MRDRTHHRPALDRRHVAENLHRLPAHGGVGGNGTSLVRAGATAGARGRQRRGGRPRGREGNVLEILEGVERVLRRLHRDVVAHPVLGVQPEARRGLKATAGGGEQAARDVPLLQAHLQGLGAIDVDHQLGIVGRLLDAQIGGPRHGLDLVEQLGGKGAVALQVIADDLHVDGCRQSEVQDLGDDVHRQLIERHPRKALGEDGPETLDVGGGGVVLRRQGHLNVGVRWPDRCRVRISQVDAAVGKSDVVDDRDQLVPGNDLPEGVVDLVAETGNLLDPRPGVSAHVNFELAAVDRGKEVLSQEGVEEHRRCHRQAEERDQEKLGVGDTQLEDPVITAAESLEQVLETPLKPHQDVAAGAPSFLGGGVRLPQQVLGHGGDNGSREDVGGQHREADRLGERHEQELGHAAQEEHRHEDDADRDGRHQGRDGDLSGAIQDGVLDLLALVEVAVDVLDLDGGVVDQDPHREGQPPQRHDVDGFAQGSQRQQRRENGQGDRDGDDHGAAPASQEDQDHEGRQAGGDDGLAHHSVDGRANEHRLIGQRRDLQVRGELRPENLQLVADPLHDVERGGLAGLDHRQQRRALPVDAHDVGLGRKPVTDVGHVADEHHRSVGGAHREVVQIVQDRG